jgi:hypothetical protein
MPPPQASLVFPSSGHLLPLVLSEMRAFCCLWTPQGLLLCQCPSCAHRHSIQIVHPAIGQPRVLLEHLDVSHHQRLGVNLCPLHHPHHPGGPHLQTGLPRLQSAL